MPVQLNHTIVWCKDQQRSATFMSEVFGLPPAERFGPFLVVDMANGVSLDYMDVDMDIPHAHYAFLVTEPEFDDIFGRVKKRDLPYWADPHQNEPGEINHHDGGRGVYFPDPDGHMLEIITRPYGSGG